MYARYSTMRFYNRVAILAEKAWTFIQWLSIAFVLYMALSQVYVGIVRNAEDRGAERKKIENLETWKKLNATPFPHK